MGDGNPEVIEAGQFLGEDGVFQENWQDHLDEDLRGSETLNNVKDVRSMAKMLIHAESKIGKDKVVLPTDESSDEERAEFYTRLGRPEKADQYGITTPEGADKEFASSMSEAMHGAGLTTKQAQAVVQAYQAYGTKQGEAGETQTKLEAAESNKALHDLWGQAYDSKISTAKVGVEAFVRELDENTADLLLEEIPYNPVSAQLFAKLGAMVGEDKGLKHGSAALSPVDADAKIQELYRDPYFLSSHPEGMPFNKEKHQAIVDEIRRLKVIQHN